MILWRLLGHRVFQFCELRQVNGGVLLKEAVRELHNPLVLLKKQSARLIDSLQNVTFDPKVASNVILRFCVTKLALDYICLVLLVELFFAIFFFDNLVVNVESDLVLLLIQ